MSFRKISLVIFLIIINSEFFAQGGLYDLPKGNQKFRKMGIHDGNLVRTTFLNTGQVALFDDPPNGEWPKGSGHNYMDGVAILIATKIKDSNGVVYKTVETEYRERTDPEPRVGDKQWGCEPLPGFADETQSSPAFSDKPKTWPSFWPKFIVGTDSGKGTEWDGHWNGYFGLDIVNADQESYFYYDDSNDEEYPYYPDPTDKTRRGMGILVKVRGLQWSQVLAEDCIFWLYEITNISKTQYDSVAFGMYADAGIGGKSDQNDDKLNFNSFYDITYAYDNDGIGYGFFQPTAYAGYAFLESPGNNDDGIDNDEDGLIDERRDNTAGVFLTESPFGVADPARFQIFYGRPPSPHWSGDENGDWSPVTDDVGSDGVGTLSPNYTGPDIDGTENNGKPDQGEPHFGKTDLDESDQIGLTSAQYFNVGTVWPKDDNELYQRLTPGLPTSFQTNETSPNNIGFVYGSGFFSLGKKETERFSMALLFGADRDDLFRNKETVQQIYNANYQFAKAPLKPVVTSVAGDKKVTLYWDRRAENSWDPIYGADFEGYAIYRSTEPSFSSPEIKSITDMFGIPTYRKPLAQFDYDEGIKGEDPVGVKGAHFNRGNDSGLLHSWVDTNVVNGQTYYYAVVSYDRGYHLGIIDEVKLGAPFDDFRNSIPAGLLPIAVSECPANIEIDQAGNVVGFDDNTVSVTPRAPSVGYVKAIADVNHVSGPGTGKFDVALIDPPAVRENTYELTFRDSKELGDNGIFTRQTLSYSVFDEKPVTETFIASDSAFVLLQKKNILKESVELRTEDGTIIDSSLYSLDATNGRIRSSANGNLIPGKKYIITYNYYPILDSKYIGYNEEGDPFDGLKIFFQNDGISRVTDKTGWTPESKTTWEAVINPPTTTNKIVIPSDIELRFSDNVVDTSYTGIGGSKTPVNFSIWDLTNSEKMKFRFKDNDGNTKVSSGDDIEPLVLLPLAGGQFQNLTIWTIKLKKDTLQNSVEPSSGDTLKIVVTKPFRNGDVFTIKTTAHRVDVQTAKSSLDNIYVVPNPYVATTAIESSNNFRLGRGERRIEFVHLPPECTIRIYTMSGYLVNELFHEKSVDNGSEFWDLRTKDQMDAAYGYYVYIVDAPGMGTKTGKFALIK